MKLLLKITILLLAFIQYNCRGQQNASEADKQLVATYQKYVTNQYEYDTRDKILSTFKNNLKEKLESLQLSNYFFPLLNEECNIIKSEDNNLTIISWDWLNNGTWHVYESMYRFLDGDKIYTGSLYQKDDTESGFKDGFYIDITKLPDNSYLVKGYGTHGGAKDFYVFRKLSFVDGKLRDCQDCFDGSETLVFEKSRVEDIKLEYDQLNKIISFPKQVSILKDGEDTGFLKVTDTLLKFKYKEGKFIKLEDN